VFFPAITRVASETILAQQPTLTITPAASALVIIIGAETWAVYTLTAGAHAGDATHILPLDYHATTNAKHWLITDTGYVANNTLINDQGRVLVDASGNPLIFS
jgi:hypothetical protein